MVWANPLWELLELVLGTERGQILILLQEFVHSLPVANVTWGNWSPPSMNHSLRLWGLRKLRRWLRWGLIFSVALLDFWASRWGVGSIIGLFGGLCCGFA